MIEFFRTSGSLENKRWLFSCWSLLTSKPRSDPSNLTKISTNRNSYRRTSMEINSFAFSSSIRLNSHEIVSEPHSSWKISCITRVNSNAQMNIWSNREEKADHLEDVRFSKIFSPFFHSQDQAARNDEIWMSGRQRKMIKKIRRATRRVW